MQINYRCADHGVFQMSLRVGRGNGPAPDEVPCPECSLLAIKRRGTTHERGYRNISLTTPVYDKIRALADKSGKTLSEVVASLLEDI